LIRVSKKEITLFEMVATSIYLSEVDTSIVLCLNVVVKHQLTVIELLLNKKKKTGYKYQIN
jgi:hypothetical protein